MLRAAGVLSWLLAAGFGPLCIPAMVSIARGDGVWTFLGFPTYGGAVFEQLGLPTSVPLLAGFLLVAVAEVIVGVLLWMHAGRGRCWRSCCFRSYSCSGSASRSRLGRNSGWPGPFWWSSQ
jgi:hypothetical protein